MLAELLLLAHVVGATVLFGTGAGIAFFMVMAHRTREPALIAHVAGTVVIADTIFTATAAILQPVTGYLLARIIGWDLTESWIALSLLLYVVTGIFWLPVVWIQIRLRDLARTATAAGTALPPAYFSLYRIWFAFGFPAFFAVTGILLLMLTKPTLF
ncbi:putative membrane protein [Rhizobium sp. BK196]|jgi:uncharacterized membrane protein|uniref:DUF2269 family protein n=1 Tax=Rhizobium sp. BK196 TaxID=2587073 RepID=UPI00161B7BB5|nr:DUF2269 domain-containing protein [Rhizobium sp. BK196]MBB3308975.1 putative membrane protein [Rhizobium sp. BK196]